MTLTRNCFIKIFALLFIAMTFIQCQKEDISPNDPNDPNNSNNPPKTGTVNMQMTDAPIDNANIEGVFVTVAEVKIDGKTYDNFSGKQTIDIMAYQNGEVKALGISELETGTYSSISLVLDYESDVNGQTPGCYVLTTDGLKESLQSSSENTEEIEIAYDFEVVENSQTDLVIDFDLRKTITAEEENNGQWDFSFVTNSELDAGLRVVNETETGHVSGTCTEALPLFESDKIVVYAYNTGTFSSESEMHGQGSSNIEFANAVTSAAVNADGSYKLSFLNEGDYELVYVAYDDDSTGNLSIKGQLDLIVDLGIDLQMISVSAQSSTSVNVNIIGLVP